MRIKQVAVKKLFGIFDHRIPMDKPEGVTIIHGPNGFGKTVMLKMIAGALRGDPSIFQTIPFDEFRLEFDDESSWTLRARRERSSRKAGFGPQLTLVTSKNGQENTATLRDAPDSPSNRQILNLIDTSVPRPYARSGAGWRDNAGTPYSLDQILTLFPDAASTVPPEVLARLRGGVWKPLGIDVFVIEANRLAATGPGERKERMTYYSPPSYDDDESMAPGQQRINQYSADLVQRIKTVRSDYAKVTQERDSTFPERLIQFMRTDEVPLGESDIVIKLKELDQKRRHLIGLGFLDKEGVLGVFRDEDARLARQALTIYVDDVGRKLSAFDDMAGRSGKLIEIIKDRFEYKTLGIHREQGFVVESEAGGRVNLADLSSGEQHELILLYELLFQTPKNGLILVDEPEISLHVAWQSRFLSDLIDVLRLNGAYALVATHSPTVIGTQWDLTTELRGPKSRPDPRRD
jgi:energy-coupling factor transporter ATP-binding protein EcfA2